MAFRPFVRIRMGPDEEPTSKHINLVQDNISDAIAQIAGKDDLDGMVIKNVKLTPSGINYVNHGLGHQLHGWGVVRTHGTGTAFIQVWDQQDTNSHLNAKTQLYLMASATGTFDIRVF
jgi:hypothetical protein